MDATIESNPIIDRLPAKLKQFIKPQDYHRYTAVDQSVWRYVMRKNVQHLQHVAHGSYLEGLDKTGITIDKIPSMYGMNRILEDIGWAAVAVDGFIPPHAFMEFQAYNTLVIAADIRQMGHIEYTPTPDIIHESAGHAPILANREYAEYLRRFGQIGSKAISSALDHELFQAIRTLSILKESPHASTKEVEEAEGKVDILQNQISYLSEMTQMRNLHWWTVEYGLIGSVDNYRQYGAGLLSSIGESKWCMSEKVKKLPYTIEAAQQNFDVTQPQPQLYVTPDFAHLSLILEEFAEGLSIRKGGIEGLKRLIESGSIGTIELSTGLQVSGVFSRVIEDEKSRNGIAYFQTTGETVLANRDKQLTGHGRLDHPNGIGSPMGYLKGYNLAIEDMSPRDLSAYDIHEANRTRLEFEGGVIVEGKVITGARNVYGKIQTIYFDDCLVTYRDEVLFTPEMGTYCMTVGKEIISAFAGPADSDSFDLLTHTVTEDKKDRELPMAIQKLNSFFDRAGQLRNQEIVSLTEIQRLFQEAQRNQKENWLLFIDIYEVVVSHNYLALLTVVEEHLTWIATENKDVSHLITEGMILISDKAKRDNKKSI